MVGAAKEKDLRPRASLTSGTTKRCLSIDLSSGGHIRKKKIGQVQRLTKVKRFEGERGNFELDAGGNWQPMKTPQNGLCETSDWELQ